MIRSWGVPLKGTPRGAVEVLYGTKQLAYSELFVDLDTGDDIAVDLKQPVMKIITVKIPKESLPGQPAKPADRKAKKYLLKLKPFEYFEKGSDPKVGLKSRAVLQSLRRPMCSAHQLKEEGLSLLRNGLYSKAIRHFHFLLLCIKKRKRWSLSDHLLTRYINWCILELKRAKLVLKAIGLDTDMLREAAKRHPHWRRRSRGLGPDRNRVFILDESYQTT